MRIDEEHTSQRIEVFELFSEWKTPIRVLWSWNFEECEKECKDYSADRKVSGSSNYVTDGSHWPTYIQKHHLQVAFSANTPPRTGPTHTVRAKPLITTPMYNGRFSSSTTCIMIARQPWNAPAAPNPAIARPTMNIFDDVAAAHRIEPTR